MAFDPSLTPLETDLLTRFHHRFGYLGFPAPAQLVVTARTNTGAGRYTRFAHDGSVSIDEGDLGLGTYSQFDMEGLRAGASFWVYVTSGKIDYLEIVLNGEGHWDGCERAWGLIDPDTGDLPVWLSLGAQP